ncbi:MAG: shikimate dehydrogenase [Candidatus Omnitrophota bacterium]|nr:shikimate dehydrogenase [Candidatus Omnitrophota bacterium]
MTKQRYGIIGHPVAHSLSPAMQGAAFKALGIDAEYLLYDVEPDKLEGFLDDAPKKNILGLNVTIPLKIAAKDYLERKGQLDENARRLGAVNTIKFTGETPSGHNTDGPGFYRSLVKDLNFEPEGKSVFSLGAGGAARAIVMYLANGPRAIYVFDSDGEKAGALQKYYKKYYDGRKLVITDRDGLKEALSKSDLLVNATPVGMREADPSPVAKELLHPGLYVYDLVYNQLSTRLVKDANSMKLHAITGLGMLLYQGAIAFEIWTGKSAPISVMKKALREEIGKKDGS